jgi:8-hydroxy-5-deazaflavin:NADPH oxidoreductase
MYIASLSFKTNKLMRMGILGTGIVAIAIGSRLVENGHEVMLGSRNAKNEKAINWTEQYKVRAYYGTFSKAAAFGELLWNCTAGAHSLDSIQTAGIENFSGKILIDVANPLDFSDGIPPRLTICNNTSLGEEIQQLLPDTSVVKALNTINVKLMCNPTIPEGKDHITLICGDEEKSKEMVGQLLISEFGWKKENILNLGGIVHSRSTEMLIPFLISIALKTGTYLNGIKIVTLPHPNGESVK